MDERLLLHKNKIIYIPIWLDLLLLGIRKCRRTIKYLHSNMVRFIINAEQYYGNPQGTFTFQYG